MVSPFALRLAVRDVATAGGPRGGCTRSRRPARSRGRCWPRSSPSRSWGRSGRSSARAALLALGRGAAAAALARGRGRARPAARAAGEGGQGAERGLLYEHESRYQFVQVLRQSDGSRVLRLNEGVAVHSVWRRDTILTGGYWDLFGLLPPLLGRPARRCS